ncbi:MAG: hypothetical protein LBV33_08125 [Lachnospiraceae bacterium]|nr:hypothetical protein [Lachnospiraceae bacterium]
MKKTNDWIATKILSKQPFMVSRFGNTELQIVITVYMERLFGSTCQSEERFKQWLPRGWEWSGLFPPDKKFAYEFTDLLIECSKESDLLGTFFCYMDDYIITEYLPNAQLTYLTSMEPWLAANPWSAALKGLKVLVIHPFEDSIRSQYERREALFPGKNVLPEFELLTLKSVQTIAGNIDPRFDTWFEALDYMYEESLKMDFDIALIGCGAYGMPLAAKLKKAGKQAIHLGGALQLLFGIKGKRWVDDPVTKIKFNDSWVYPDEAEAPKNSINVENNCYWQ